MARVALVVLAVFLVGLAVVDGTRIIRGFKNNSTDATKYRNENTEHSTSVSQEEPDDNISESQELPHRSRLVGGQDMRAFTQSSASASANAATFSQNQMKNLV